MKGSYLGPKFENDLIEKKLKSLKGVLSSNDICITFDDTLLSQYEVALPILEKYKIRAFFFINTGMKY